MTGFTVSDLPARKYKYDELLQAASLNSGRAILVRCADTKKQQLNLLMWLRRKGLKQDYSTRIEEGQLYLIRTTEDY
jgi:hypothetical protein